MDNRIEKLLFPKDAENAKSNERVLEIVKDLMAMEASSKGLHVEFIEDGAGLTCNFYIQKHTVAFSKEELNVAKVHQMIAKCRNALEIDTQQNLPVWECSKGCRFKMKESEYYQVGTSCPVCNGPLL